VFVCLYDFRHDDRYFEALDTLAQWIQVNEKLDRKPQSYKCFLSVIILRLVVGDYVAAEQALTQYLQYVCLTAFIYHNI